MNIKDTNRSDYKGRGSALILVVVVTVLLAMVGIMFLMVSRVGDMMGSGARQEYEMDQAVGAVTARIEHILLQDLFGPNLSRTIADGGGASNEPYDAPGQRDPWLASLEPVWHSDNGTSADPTDDLYIWPYISNILTGTVNFGDQFWDRIIRDGGSNRTLPQHNGLVPDYQEADLVLPAHPADADGDGVADSVWIPLSAPTGSGQTIYAAVRIIDNCAMLNLNTAHKTQAASPWYGQGRWLSEVDYQAFLRGNDRATPIVIKRARMANIGDPFDTFEQHHDRVIMNIENPGSSYTLFDIGDEQEIRNRFCLTSKAQARFEQENRLTGDPSTFRFGLYETFDLGRGDFRPGWNVARRVKRIPVESSDELIVWKQRMNPDNFDDSDPANTYGYYYDRRHVCTFYSFDRNLRSGGDPFLAALTESEQEIYKKVFMPADGQAVSVRSDILSNTPEARRNILHLLCAFRAYYLDQGAPPAAAARRAAQVVANMIDYLDDNVLTTQGPFYDSWTDPDNTSDTVPGQTNDKPTFLNRTLIKRLILEASTALHSEDSSVPILNVDQAPFAAFDFGLAGVVYGYERQPFVSELYVMRDDSNNTAAAALELINPYNASILLTNWRILFNETGSPRIFDIPAGTTIPAATSGTPGRLVIRSNSSVPVTGASVTIANFGMGTQLADANSIDLQRPDPRDPNPSAPTMFVAVDRIHREQILPMLTDTPADGQPTNHALKRQDSGWKFTNANAVRHERTIPPAASPATLGAANGITITQHGWQMPVANFASISADRSFFTLGDFQKVLFVGNQGGADPNSATVTTAVAAAQGEGDIRFDIVGNPELLGYICFLNREKGSLPGRININTAPKHVLAAAIQITNSLDFANEIVTGRTSAGYANLGDLLSLPRWDTPRAPSSGDDITISGDLQERDGLLANVSNIFTTRSDVFTAYILVRLGPSGPQRRVMAIFDRSQVWTAEDRPRIVAIKTVPNPR